jgi:hypothetical protein
MPVTISPEVERVFSQLLWIEHRRARIVESVSAHFGQAKLKAILENEKLLPAPLENAPDFSQLLDEKDPDQFLCSLAMRVERHDAETIHALRKHVSVYQQHADEQILFGARTSGQEAGRSFLAGSKPATKGRQTLSVPEAVQALFTLTYNGLPGEQNHFLVIRPQGGSTVHYTKSPHLEAWTAAGADPKFLYNMKCEWLYGALDILCPEAGFVTSHAIEKGNAYGLAHFFHKGLHAGL